MITNYLRAHYTDIESVTNIPYTGSYKRFTIDLEKKTIEHKDLISPANGAIDLP